MHQFNEIPELSVQKIIAMAGGAKYIIKCSRGETKIKQSGTIIKWKLNGIPWKYWSFMMNLTGLEPSHLHAANLHSLELFRQSVNSTNPA